MPVAPSAGAIHRARRGFRKAAIRHALREIVEGKHERVSIESTEMRLEAARIVEEMTAGKREDAREVQLLQVAFVNSKQADDMVERLAAKSIHDRIASARLIGALRMYDAVSWLSPLLAARDRSVADTAARSLGRIGGARSATALVTAIQRRGVHRRLVAELARAAPDFFIEAALGEQQRPGVRPALAIAAGLRRRRTAISPLLWLLQTGSRKERVISCRALGWIGAESAVPVIEEALHDRDWKIRMAAAKALGALAGGSSRRRLEELYADRNTRVRKAAHQAVRRLSHGA